MELIAGDIGGTKSWLVWVVLSADGCSRAETVRHEKIYASADFESAEALMKRFMSDAGSPATPDQLLLALPGALHEQRATLTNLAWTLDAAQLQRALGIRAVRFINDFQAAAAGVATLSRQDVITLNHAAPEPDGVRAITGAGTGLGLAFMLPDATGRYRSYATEGGHADFAPANPVQSRLLEQLRSTYGHVSWERAVSGSALHDLYAFCCVEAGQSAPDHAVDGATLVERAESGDAVAETAVDLFVDLYGAWLGNVALMYQPRGGLYIAGGVAAHLQSRMQSPRLLTAAFDKGRMRSVVERTPIHLVTCNRLGVQGAIASAFHTASKTESAPSLQTA